MRLALTLALSLLVAPVARADTNEPRSVPEPRVEVVAPAAPSAPKPKLEEVEVSSARKPAQAEEGESEALPQRGSFWWMVGVIVVAGVILAVLL